MIKVVWQLKVNFGRMIWENYGKKNYFTSYQTILGNPVSMIRENMERRIFTQYRKEFKTRKWFDFSGSAKLLIIIPIVYHCLWFFLYRIVSKTDMLFILHYM